MSTTKSASCPAVQFRFARPTDKLEAVEHFYVTGIGLKKIYSFEDHDGYKGIMLGLPEATYHLEFTQNVEKTPCPAPTKDNLLVLYFEGAEELNLVKNRLEQMGIQEVEPENSYWQTNGFTYEDPDGWRVVLYKGTFNPL